MSIATREPLLLLRRNVNLAVEKLGGDNSSRDNNGHNGGSSASDDRSNENNSPINGTSCSNNVAIEGARARQEVLCTMLLLAALHLLEKSGKIPGGAHITAANVEAQLRALFDCTRRSVSPEIADSMFLPKHFDLAKILETREVLTRNQEPYDDLGECLLGYVYQFFCAPNRKASLKRVQTANKSLSTEDIVGFTQLYTPSWVADYLIETTLTEYFQGTDRMPTLIDPSCGSGHFLLRAFDYLLPRSTANENGVSAPHTVAHDLLNYSLFGCDIDGTALWVTALSLIVKVLKVSPTSSTYPQFKTLKLDKLVSALEGQPEIGALGRDWPEGHVLSRRYDAVLGNPPYIGRKLIDRQLKAELKALYPFAHQDLCTAFVARGLELLKPKGRLGYITQSSLLYLPTYAKFRQQILQEQQLVEIVEAGTQVFPLQNGEKINSILLVVENSKPTEAHTVSYTDLRDSPVKAVALAAAVSARRQSTICTDRLQRDFANQPRGTLNFQCPPAFHEIRQNTLALSDIAEVKQGLATSDNDRFLREFWQVPENEIGKRWIPYVKGSGCERWTAPIKMVVDWDDNGAAIKQAVLQAYPYLNGNTAWVVKNERYYGRAGLTFSFVNSRELAVRYLPGGCIFDVAGSAVFAKNVEDQDFLLAYLNSSFINTSAKWLNPTINFQVGDLKQLPILPMDEAERSRLKLLGQECLRTKLLLIAFGPRGYKSPTPAAPKSAESLFSELSTIAAELTGYELEIDNIVLGAARRSVARAEDFAELRKLCEQNGHNRKRSQSPFQTLRDAELWYQNDSKQAREFK